MPNMEETLMFLRDRRLFCALDANELRQTAEHSTRIELKRDQVLFSKGETADAAYIIVSGEIAIEVISLDGRPARMAHLGTGEVFGEFACLDNGERTADARAIIQTSVLKIDKAHFNTLAASNKTFARAIITDLVRKLRETDASIEDVTFLDLQARAAKLIIQQQEAQSADDGSLVNVIVITQAELADRLGASREKINGHLQALQKTDAIKLARGRIEILDYDNLVKLGKG